MAAIFANVSMSHILLTICKKDYQYVDCTFSSLYLLSEADIHYIQQTWHVRVSMHTITHRPFGSGREIMRSAVTDFN